tara:strand:+ start:293 stop:913 length:621 start_codon:yes stop_codon:yes gene_type:complete
MNNSILYSTLTRFGEYYPLKLKNKVGNIVDTLNNEFDWVQYNPRKNIDRQGLSVTSLDGGMSGKPDLDSLYEYYDQTGIVLNETNFTTKTPAYKYFKKWLDPLDGHLGRTHVIRLNRGGFFPPHRDNTHSNIESFRLFLPLTYSSEQHFFLLEDKKMEFKNGEMYFIDTAKMHTLFCTGNNPFYFLVTNVILTQESVDATLKFLHS